MTPLFFRGSILMIENILSYSEFMSMKYRDFKRIEAVWMFKNKQVQNRIKQQSQNETISKLSNVPTRSVQDMGFSKEQLKAMFS
jgi:hypothetical protein